MLKYSELFIVVTLKDKKVTVFNGLSVLGWVTSVVQSTHQFEQ